MTGTVCFIVLTMVTMVTEKQKATNTGVSLEL